MELRRMVGEITIPFPIVGDPLAPIRRDLEEARADFEERMNRVIQGGPFYLPGEEPEEDEAWDW